MFFLTTLFTNVLTSGKRLVYSDGFSVIFFPRVTLFVILPLFKVSPYANKSKKIINICEESEQNTEQTLYSLEKINQLPKTAHLKVQN
jgi:hypothetical protein